MLLLLRSWCLNLRAELQPPPPQDPSSDQYDQYTKRGGVRGSDYATHRNNSIKTSSAAAVRVVLIFNSASDVSLRQNSALCTLLISRIILRSATARSLGTSKTRSNLLLLQASSPIQQLELITDLLGTPTLSDMKYACEAAKRHMLSRGCKPPSVTALYTLGASATHEAIHLLCQMLTLDPEKRISVGEALNHPYLDEGRLRYHSCMCTCCVSTPAGMRQYTRDFEPAAEVSTVIIIIYGWQHISFALACAC